MKSRDGRRQHLHSLYGFDFPDDLYRFWDFANRLRPLEPLAALEPLDLHLVGPFDVLAGGFDGRLTRFSQLLHWRYANDPPEFFTVLSGAEDGLHWGYYLDEPGEPGGCVASYYAHDVLELSADGETLFEAVRMVIEQRYDDVESAGWRKPDEDDESLLPHTRPLSAAQGRQLSELDRIRSRLMAYATAERPECAAEYEEKYQGVCTRDERVLAPTLDGMGIVAPGDTYRPLSLDGGKLRKRLQSAKGTVALVEEARQALRDGYPATALKLGKDLWALGGPERTEYAYELLDAAYAALRRPVLREVLRVHRANRDLPCVDILEMEERL
jgi:hypothetical protein